MRNTIEYAVGDLLHVTADAIVNPWNRNYFGRWFPSSGVSGALKQATGSQPWIELERHGIIGVGDAVTTSPGNLTQFQGIIHVAGLNSWWRATEQSIRKSVTSALDEVRFHGWNSVALPLIGAGTGGIPPEQSKHWISDQITQTIFDDISIRCVVVEWEKTGMTNKLYAG